MRMTKGELEREEVPFCGEGVAGESGYTKEGA